MAKTYKDAESYMKHVMANFYKRKANPILNEYDSDAEKYYRRMIKRTYDNFLY